MTKNKISEWMEVAFARNGFPGIIVRYWGHDPDDLEMGTEEDGWSGIYDAFMIPDDRLDEFRKLYYSDSFGEDIGRECLFHPPLVQHGVAATIKYYPQIVAVQNA